MRRYAIPENLVDPVGWTGDVWKVMMALLDLRPDLQIDIIGAYKTGLACISGLDPNSTELRDNYEALLQKYQTMDLSDIGADGIMVGSSWLIPVLSCRRFKTCIRAQWPCVRAHDCSCTVS